MNYTLIALPLLVLLPASILIKSEFEVDYYPLERIEIAQFSPNEYLANTGFVFQGLPGTNEYLGINGTCLVTVGVSGRDGDSDAIFEGRFKSDEYNVRYIYKGVIASSPMYFRAQFDHYREMLKVAVGRQPEPTLMLHIAMTKSCKSSDFVPLHWES